MSAQRAPDTESTAIDPTSAMVACERHLVAAAQELGMARRCSADPKITRTIEDAQAYVRRAKFALYDQRVDRMLTAYSSPLPVTTEAERAEAGNVDL